MSLDIVNDIIGKAIQVTLLVSLPSVVLGLLAGVIVAVIQALTQVQEQTLTFVPKMIVILLVLGVTFSWSANIVLEMTIALWSNIPLYAK
jgi:flagellar biosynthetic protein FliQ